MAFLFLGILRLCISRADEEGAFFLASIFPTDGTLAFLVGFWRCFFGEQKPLGNAQIKLRTDRTDGSHEPIHEKRS